MSSGNQCKAHRRQSFFRRLCALLVTLIVIVLVAVLVVWLVLRPTKPQFALQDATITQLNITSPNTLTSSLQVTLYSRNPNERIGIYYDQLVVYAAYRNQQITLPSMIPPFYQGKKDVSMWSPVIVGVSVPVSPSLCFSLDQDQKVGLLMVMVKMDGKIRWKVGSWISGHYHLAVSCPAYMTKDSSIRLQHPSGCSATV